MNTNNEQRLSSNDDLFFKDCFTEVDEGKVDAEFNNISMNCFNSKNNKFSMDSDGNLAVNSITSKESISAGYNIDLIYPIGSIYMSVNPTNPGTLFGGTWEQIKDCFILACGSTFANGTTGGDTKASAQFEMFTGSGIELYMDINREDFNKPYNSNTRFVTGASSAKELGLIESQHYGIKVGNLNNPEVVLPPYLAVCCWKRIA